MKTFTISPALNPSTGKYQSGYILPPEAAIWEESRRTKRVRPLNIVRPSASLLGIKNTDFYGITGREAQIDIVPNGGAFPYYCVVKSAPAGFSISNDPNSPDYLVLKFTPMSDGENTIDLIVYDADYEMVRLKWVFTVTDSAFAFVTKTGNDTTGDGTRANPWLTLEKARASVTDGRCLLVGAGTYDAKVNWGIGPAFCGSIANLDSERPVFDYSSETGTGNAHFNMSTADGYLMTGIVIQNPSTLAANPRIFDCSGTRNDIHVSNVDFLINGRLGTANNDNISCFYFNDVGASARSRISIVRSYIDKMTSVGATSNGWSLIDTYASKYVVIDGITVGEYQGTGTVGGAGDLIWLKGQYTSHVDIRRMNFLTPINGNLLGIYLGNSGLQNNVTGDVHIYANLIRSNNTRDGISIFRGSQNGTRLPVHTSRNTLIGAMITLYRRSYQCSFYSDGDVIQNTQNTSGTGTSWKISLFDQNDPAGVHRPLSDMTSLTYGVTRSECQASTGVVDSSGNLIGSYAQYTGTHGHIFSRD